MNTYSFSLALVAIMATNAAAFSPAPAFTMTGPSFATRVASSTTSSSSSSADDAEPQNVAEAASKPVMEATSAAEAPVAPKKKKAAPPKKSSNDGVFSPVVKTAKTVMGATELNKLRGKVIGMHSEVIGNFVDTSESAFGKTVLKQFFKLADADRNGTLEEEELVAFMQSLGFDFLTAKQMHGIFERADADKDGHIDEEEWMKTAPKTLRTNLIKLAKKNGHDMGLLA